MVSTPPLTYGGGCDDGGGAQCEQEAPAVVVAKWWCGDGGDGGADLELPVENVAVCKLGSLLEPHGQVIADQLQVLLQELSCNYR